MRSSRIPVLFALSFVPALSLACLEGEPPPAGPLDVRVALPAAPENGVQLVQPDIVVPAGTELQTCWVADWVAEEDTFVKGFVTYQGAGGHHVVAMTTDVPREPGSVFDCTSPAQMATLRPVILPTGGFVSGEELVTDSVMPGNFMVRVKAGERIVVQSHYVNAQLEDILVRDVANVEFVDPAELAGFTEANWFTLTDIELDIPQGTQTLDTSCVVDDTWQFTLLFGHMHENGRSIKIERERAGVVDEVYQIDGWTASMRDKPPVTKYEQATPFVLEPGDRLSLHCEWENNKDHNLRFPEEMCVMIGAYFPAKPEGFHVCE